MKKYFLLVLAIGCLASCATSSDFHSFYKENKKEADISISTPSIFVNMFIPKEDVKEFKELFRKVKHYKIMIYENEMESLDAKFDRFIARKNYETVFKINEKGEKLQFYFLKRGDLIKEMVLKIKEEDSFVIVGLKTNILQQDFNAFISKTDKKIVTN